MKNEENDTIISEGNSFGNNHTVINCVQSRLCCHGGISTVSIYGDKKVIDAFHQMYSARVSDENYNNPGDNFNTVIPNGTNLTTLQISTSQAEGLKIYLQSLLKIGRIDAFAMYISEEETDSE